MCSKKIEKRQRVASDELVETGEQKIMEMLEIKGEYIPIQSIDDENMWSVSSQFRESDAIARTIAFEEQEKVYKPHKPKNEEDSYKQVLESIEVLEDDTNDIIQGNKNQTNNLCRFDNMPISNIHPNLHTFEINIPDDVSISLETDENQDFNEIATESEKFLDDEFGIATTQLLEDLEGIF